MGKSNPDTSKWGDYTNTQLDAEFGKVNDYWSKNFFGPGTNPEIGKILGAGAISEVADQIKIYKAANAVKAEAASEKRRVEEKQIRALRNNYRRPGGGGFGMGGENQTTGTLGSGTGLPNKLGTA